MLPAGHELNLNVIARLHVSINEGLPINPVRSL
jgi:hypothetical protein